MDKYYLAIDIGASSGRHILARQEGGKLLTEEIYRFPNGMIQRNGHACWDHEALWAHILTGMKKCREIGKFPVSVGIDTWGVDYVLLDENDRMIGDAVAYRDDRTEGMAALLAQKLTPEKQYSLTGICYQPFNTIYQLMADFREYPEKKSTAKSLLFIPCWLTWKLSGKKLNEYSFASTSGLLNCHTRDWDPEVLAAADIPGNLLGSKPVLPGTVVGTLQEEIRREVGYDCQVILPATHDTGSAFLSVPARDENAAFLSSGTWSLLGTESDEAITSNRARVCGFTNEGGIDGRIRFLRNIMGLWPLQCIRQETNNRFTFAEMAEMAEVSSYSGVTRINDNRYLAPKNMLETVREDLKEQGAPEPKDLSDLLRAVTVGLAVCYRDSIHDMEELVGRPFTSVNIVGGGSQNRTLNRLTAFMTGLPVFTGPAEGTALGNLACQMIALGVLKDRQEARNLIRNSTDIVCY